jgi:hypothetical protein
MKRPALNQRAASGGDMKNTNKLTDLPASVNQSRSDFPHTPAAIGADGPRSVRPDLSLSIPGQWRCQRSSHGTYELIPCIVIGETELRYRVQVENANGEMVTRLIDKENFLPERAR